ncbi:MAG: hypothetical protein K1060chlam2_00827 [Chlamydiae bacterium]|nr:hypothetical protein [Chlamydiota bacterium]
MGKEANVYGLTDKLLRGISGEEEVFFDRVAVSWDSLILGLKEERYGRLEKQTAQLSDFEAEISNLNFILWWVLIW